MTLKKKNNLLKNTSSKNEKVIPIRTRHPQLLTCRAQILRAGVDKLYYTEVMISWKNLPPSLKLNIKIKEKKVFLEHWVEWKKLMKKLIYLQTIRFLI